MLSSRDKRRFDRKQRISEFYLRLEFARVSSRILMLKAPCGVCLVSVKNPQRVKRSPVSVRGECRPPSVVMRAFCASSTVRMLGAQTVREDPALALAGFLLRSYTALAGFIFYFCIRSYQSQRVYITFKETRPFQGIARGESQMEPLMFMRIRFKRRRFLRTTTDSGIAT